MKKAFGIFAIGIITMSSCKKAEIPVLTTNEVTEITTNMAVSGGIIIDDGGAKITTQGICWNTQPDPSTENNKTTEPGSTSFSSNITNLLPDTQYYIRAYAINEAGTGYGNNISFKTLGDKPALASLNATNITVISATLNGSVNPNFLASTVTFEYGTSLEYGNSIPLSEQLSVDGESHNVAVDITGLTPGTVYNFRIKAINEVGTGYGNNIVFKTLGDKPALASQNATNITVNSATLNGSVNPNLLATTVTFEYGTSLEYGNSIPLSEQLSVDGESHNVAVDITGLTPGTVYNFRIKAINSIGTSVSANQTFTTAGQKPAATTLTIKDVTQNSVTLSAMVNANLLPTQVSFEWGTTSAYGNTLTPTPNNNLTGSSNTNILLSLTGLQKGTIYHYRVKAVNELGTTYGQDVQFTTLAEPVVSTLFISSGTTSIISGYSITNDFGSEITEKGIYWSQYPSPGLIGNDGNKISYTGTENKFNLNITGLSPNSTYYVRAYAKNSVGIGFGEDIIFRTYTGSVSDTEGNTYFTVTIGTQVWMAENLKSKKFLNGDPIETTTDDIHSALNPEYQWAYNNNESNVAVYGRLYTWYTANDTRNICPTGWHVPSTSELSALVSYLGGYLTSAGNLKEAGTNHWESPNVGATNNTGFTGLPGGYRADVGTFIGLSTFGMWWTTGSFILDQEVYGNSFSIHSSSVTMGYGGGSLKAHALSVRCIKD
jgi:uncharacterized protein (TIGR02145 family)